MSALRGMVIGVIVLGIGFSVRSYASVNKDNPTTGTATNDFPCVGMVGDTNGFYCSGTLIGGGRYVLTARHCVTTDGTINGTPKAAGNMRFKVGNTTYVGNQLFTNFGADIAVICLTTAAPDSYNLYMESMNGSEVGKTFCGVGFGDIDSDGNGIWDTEQNPPILGGYGTKRVFYNKVDSVQAGGLTGQGSVLRYDYDKTGGDPVATGEGISGPGDSGGGVFIQVGSELLLAGVISSSGNPVNGATGSNVRVSDYKDAILQVIPEPGTALLILFAAPMLARRGRR